MRIKKRTYAVLVTSAPLLALIGLILTVDGCDRAWRDRIPTPRVAAPLPAQLAPATRETGRTGGWYQSPFGKIQQILI